MDPDAALEELRQLVSRVDVHYSDLERLKEVFEGLDAWLTDGGFLPGAWQR